MHAHLQTNLDIALQAQPGHRHGTPYHNHRNVCSILMITCYVWGPGYSCVHEQLVSCRRGCMRLVTCLGALQIKFRPERELQAPDADAIFS
jgi:hypothetical protein